MPTRPGADYIKALQDGREIWNAGRRIEDVTKHSGFAGTIKTLAALYDKQHELEYRDMMTFERDGERTSYSFLAPRDAEQLALKRRNIEFWSQARFGQIGRFPEFVAELVVGLLDWTHVLEKHNKQWGRECQSLPSLCQQQRPLPDALAYGSVLGSNQARQRARRSRFDSSHRRRNHGWAGGARLANSRHVSADFRRSIGISESAARTGGSRLCDRFCDSDEHAGIENRLPRPLRGACRS
jgi:hypothetical protein